MMSLDEMERRGVAQRHEGRLDDCAWEFVVCVGVCELVNLVGKILFFFKKKVVGLCRC